MTKLSDLATKYGTDKGPNGHNYTEFYWSLLFDVRVDPVVFLEIGVAGGESIQMWGDWFTNPETKIYGVDIEDRPLPQFDQRTKIIIGDASKANFIYDLTNVTGPLDIVVDDGSHTSQQQKDTLRLLWPHIKPGGLMIVEDTHCSYCEPWTLPDEISFIRHLDSWIDEVMERGAGQCGRPTASTIEEIIIRKSLVVFKKR